MGLCLKWYNYVEVARHSSLTINSITFEQTKGQNEIVTFSDMFENLKSTSKSSNWRDFIPPQNVGRSVELTRSNTYEWATSRCSEPFMIGWTKVWNELYEQPYKGITTDGHVIPDLFQLGDNGDNHGAPVAAMAKAARKLVSVATLEQKGAISKDIDAHEWRAWMNQRSTYLGMACDSRKHRTSFSTPHSNLCGQAYPTKATLKQ